MPVLSAVGDPRLLPTPRQVGLLADVAITPVNTFVDIVTLGTIPAGTYFVAAYATIAQITAASVVTAKILAGAAIIAATEVTVAVGAGIISIPWTLVTLGADTIVKLQLASTVLTSTAKKVALNNGTGTDNVTTVISALRIA